MQRRPLLTLISSLTLALAAAAPLAQAQAGKDIKIAHINGRTGPLEAYAKQSSVGFMMGLDYATGGTMTVAGRKIVVIEKDDQGKPDLGKNLLAAAYGDDKVDLAVGTTGSGVALAMLPVAEEYKKLLIVEPAVADSITGDKWNKLHLPHRPQQQPGRPGQCRGLRPGRHDHRHAGAGLRLRPRRREGLQGRDQEGQGGARRVRAAERHRHHRRRAAHLRQAQGPAGQEGGVHRLGRQPGRAFQDAGPGAAALRHHAGHGRQHPAGHDACTSAFPAWKARCTTTSAFPRTRSNEWLVANHYKQFKSPPDFFTAGGMSAAIAVVEALKKTKGDTNTEKLIAAMEGMSFETPKGKMTFRKEDHQAMQSMFHFKIKVDPAFEWGVPELVREIKPEDMNVPIRNKR